MKSDDFADQVRLAGAIRLMLLLVKVKEPLQGSQDDGSLSVIFAVLFGDSLGIRPRSYIVPTGKP